MKYAKDYLPHDQYLVINDNDTSLRPVVLKLPDPPDLKLIDGYGLPIHEQYFIRKETPDKLLQVEKRARKEIEKQNEKSSNNRFNGYHIQKEFWKIIEEERDSLQEEIKWMWANHWYLRYGYWFYNCGKPTYISPWHFYFLNFHYLNEGKCYPDYRDVDRRNNLAKWYAYTCMETFSEIDNEGNPVSLDMKDVGRRLFFGEIKPKRRREGASNQALSVGKWILMNNKSAFCDIVADEGDHAEGLFKDKLAPSWFYTPLWLKPIWDGNEIPTSGINLSQPKTALKEDCLMSYFGFTKKSTDRALDSGQYMFVLSDESGKGRVRGNVSSAWAIIKETLAQDLIIHGWSSHPSTVEEIESGGGEYRTMFELSDFYKRKPSGQTLSGLFRIFNPAYDGMDGFIDRWGYSVIEKPTELQLKYPALKNPIYAHENKGAKESLQNELNAYLNDGSYEKLKEYRQLLRKKPMCLTDCWRGSAGDMGYNIIKIDKAIVDAKNTKTYRGNFYWAIPDQIVGWINDPKGRWIVSDFLIGRCNKWKYTISNHTDPATGKRVKAKAPMNSLICTAGIDPYRSRTASQAQSKEYGENTNLSDGGGAILLNPDSVLNGDLPDDQWPTPKFICTYRNRMNTLKEYAEDMLMMCFYYGAPCMGERNTEYVIDYFIERGYAGYLIYLMGATGKIAPQPWVFSGGQNNTAKGDMINFTAEHIEKHVQNECHVDLLTEWKSISCPEDYHKKDLATAAGWALFGYQKGYQKKIDRIERGRVIDLSKSWLRPHSI